MILQRTSKYTLSRLRINVFRSPQRILYSKRIHFSTHNSNSDDSLSPGSSSFAASSKWRKEQLNKIENKFHPNGEKGDEEDHIDNETENQHTVSKGDDNEGMPTIKSDDELQPMWKDMESRVLKRRSLTLAERGGKVGRRNIKKTDEEAWLEAGLYREDTEDSDDAQK